MKRKIYLLGMLAAMFACTEDPYVIESLEADGDLNAVYSSVLEISDPCGLEEFPLWAGQTIDAGKLVVYNDAENLFVTIISTEGFQEVSENIKMWLGTDLTLIDGGGLNRPSAGKFPFKATVGAGETTYTFKVALKDVPGYDASLCGDDATPIYVVVHADVLAKDKDGNISSQTAWGGNVPGLGKAWWFYAKYTPYCCDGNGEPEYLLETAFAYGTHVFVTKLEGKRLGSNNPDGLKYLNLSRNRWGWALNLKTGDFGTKELNIWAGAGLNNTRAGTLVGTATIVYNSSGVSVTYNMDGDYLLDEIHVYASDFVPSTVAPGQYGFMEYFDPMVSSFGPEFFAVSDSNGDGIWLILHAVVALPLP